MKSRQDLVRHVQYVHSDARPYMCLKCPKRFKRKADLSIHEQTHNPTLSYSCEHCGKAFNQKRGLKTHIQTHLSYMDKPHQCQFCSMRFVRKQTLDNHMSTHQDTKKFGCDVCGVRVKTKDALRAHRKKVHKMDGHLPPNTEIITVEALPAVAANTVISNNSIKECAFLYRSRTEKSSNYFIISIHCRRVEDRISNINYFNLMALILFETALINSC